MHWFCFTYFGLFSASVHFLSAGGKDVYKKYLTNMEMIHPTGLGKRRIKFSVLYFKQ